MRHIHPFPARMAPEIALGKIRRLRPGQTVLDPMSGSGMVLSQAARLGIDALGYDLDPLANMISRVGSTRVEVSEVAKGLKELLRQARLLDDTDVNLPWIDEDKETSDFTSFWFDEPQRMQLRRLSYLLATEQLELNQRINDLLRTSISRLIITKEPKASLARDTAHSRPHRTISTNGFDIFAELAASVDHVIKALDSTNIKSDSVAYLGDARHMANIESSSVDSIVTSPPYLNAIDYMRGHRMSLVWWGHGLKELRSIRASAIGAEKISYSSISDDDLETSLGKNIIEKFDPRTLGMLRTYFIDLTAQAREAFRVLKPGSTATYVVGNSTLKGVYIQNSEMMKIAALKEGLSFLEEESREIPNNRRYMPMPKDTSSSLGTRMREEHIISFEKL